jgi:hypothetical protein
MQVFVPLPDEGVDVRELAGQRLVPYRAGMALWAMVAAAGGREAAPAPRAPLTAPATPAAAGGRLP